MARRTYQAGSVFQSNKKRSDPWDGAALAHGRYWQDRPGQPPKRTIVNLGVCRTRTIAQRKLAEQIESQGINTTQHYIESTTTVSFQQQAEIWLRWAVQSKRNPIEDSTMQNRRCALDKWIYPYLGDTYLGEVNNFLLRDFVAHLCEKGLAPGTIAKYSEIIKAVVDSARNEQGDPLFPRRWNAEIIDAPPIAEQSQPSTRGGGISNILQLASDDRFRMLYALLAGCGPLRVGEALGLEIDKHISSDFRTLRVCQKAKFGKISQRLKTKNAYRQVDLCPELADLLREFVGNKTTGLLFPTKSGKPLYLSAVLKCSLHKILKSLGLELGGCNIFRRFRMTHLLKKGCPERLRNYWAGHGPRHISETYMKLDDEREYRLEQASQIGMGFDLPGAPVGHCGHSSEKIVAFRKTG